MPILVSRKVYIPQLALIERRQERIHRIRAKLAMLHLYQQDPMANTPDAHHVIGQSQNFPENLFTFLGQNSDDPAVKDFIPKLKAHLLPRIRAIHIEKQDSSQPPAPSVHDDHSPTSLNQVILKND
ncbi:hypothetical protein HYDPIDRAFT_29236 [Hydnomerulius pinastri MD-312]|uniref:Uncharacterized protein n=1 Tax=Hydnomerulius pinastri MD-312 TaxID=994086 RepID=A0A0C9W8M1_9AGAM|nr:hypothetical protein HYDPIDRAFT_29236 [Hydnomerulius pinastri MD-312]